VSIGARGERGARPAPCLRDLLNFAVTA